jgi:hypothetical protein
VHVVRYDAYPRRQLQYGRALTFTQMRQQDGLSVGELKRIMMDVWPTLVDLLKFRHLVPESPGEDKASSHFFRSREAQPPLGAVILSLPLVSVIAFVWLWRDTGDKEAIASLSQSTFWFVLPTLPMFLVLPALLRSDLSFWSALAASGVLTVGLYFLAAWLFPKMGIAF